MRLHLAVMLCGFAIFGVSELCWPWTILAADRAAADSNPAIEHVKVFYEKGRFAGWPANHGIWSWGDEILVGFSAGHHKDLGNERHNIDRDKPEEHLLARSRDGGKTWAIENPSKKGALIPVGKALHGIPPPDLKEAPWRECPGGIDFTHPDFALTVRMTDAHAGPARFFYSTDRGKTWAGPFRLPLFDNKGIAARTDYVVNGKHDCTLFLTAAKQDGREGRPLCVRTTDGGKSWKFVSFIGDEPKGYGIMPATVRLGEKELLTAIRRREGAKKWIEAYRSVDDGKTWKLDSVPVPDNGEGNPASLIRLADGRLCLTYGVRSAPYRMCAKLSADGGRSWGHEIVLRDDGGGRDLGYPRSVQRPDGKVVTVYYFWDKVTGPERYIASTIWDPNRVSTKVSITKGKWHINGKVTYPGAKAEGLLMNVRMVNATFEDANEKTRPKGFDADANTDTFIKQIPDYVRHGVRAFTLCLQGGSCGYEGAVNSAFNADGSLRESYLKRMRRVIEACDRNGAAVILCCYYQRQDQHLKGEAAVRAGVVNVAEWVKASGFTNVVLEIANEYAHNGYDHTILKTSDGVAELIKLAKKTNPNLLVSVSELGSKGGFPKGYVEKVAPACDFLLIHQNSRPLGDVKGRIAELKNLGKPIVCNEDDKVGESGVKSAAECVAAGVSWGLMLVKHNQHAPFKFDGSADDLTVYAMLKHLTTADDYFPPPESKGGWRKLEKPDDIRTLAGMDPDKLDELKTWLLASDKRDFAAVVVRNGYVVLEVERGNSAKTDARRVASVSKAVCATVLAIASERSQRGELAKKMRFGDFAFDFIPWARPLSDERKAKITVAQLLNHTSGLCPEATGAKNDGSWEYILGHSGDAKTEKLAFDPGTACGYSTHAFHHAALVCETVTGKPYDEFAVEALFKPIGCERWTFQHFEGGKKYGKHPSHGMGMPARDLVRLGYCMLHRGRWLDRQVVSAWFVDQTAAATHAVKGKEMRFGHEAQSFSHGWELPALRGEQGKGIPMDARFKPGSGGQLLAFVPNLGLVLARQTGGSGAWEYDEFLRRACAAVARGK